MRWAKVPEWLLPALLNAPRDKRVDASPHVALACFVAIAGTHADWRTMSAQVRNADLADELEVNTRTVRRALVLLERVGAASITNRTERGGQAVNEITLHLDHQGVGRTRPPRTPASDPSDARVTPLLRIVAGQGRGGRTHASPLYPEPQLLPEEPNASQDAEEGDVWGLDKPSEEVVQRALGECFDHIGRESASVRTLRAASHPPGPGAHVRDVGGTDGQAACEGTGRAVGPATAAEGDR